MLASAAQDVADDRESRSGLQLRELLSRAVDAASGLPEAYAATIVAVGCQPEQAYKDFLDVLDADVRKALAAMWLVLVQPRIASQLIDNLNASHHVRTLLTDVFLLDAVLGRQEAAIPHAEPVAAGAALRASHRLFSALVRLHLRNRPRLCAPLRIGASPRAVQGQHGQGAEDVGVKDHAGIVGREVAGPHGGDVAARRAKQEDG